MIFVCDTPQSLVSSFHQRKPQHPLTICIPHDVYVIRPLPGYLLYVQVDVAYQWLRFFLEDDDELERIRVEYSAGRMMSSEVKKILYDTIAPIVAAHQVAKAQVDDAAVQRFMAVRPLEF